MSPLRVLFRPEQAVASLLPACVVLLVLGLALGMWTLAAVVAAFVVLSTAISGYRNARRVR
jgi:uncharacterized membrane protein YqjE